MMKRVSSLVLLALFLSACSSGKAISQDEDDPIVLLYNQRCAGCHGLDGKPAKANLPNIPDFTNPDFHRSRKDEKLIESINDGIPPLMPSFDSRIKPEEIKELVSYIRSFSKKQEK
jgi:mono/diheme cytochrome c family protein